MTAPNAGRRARDEAWRRFTLAITSDLDLRKVFPDAILGLQDALGFDAAVLLVLDEERARLRFLAGTAEPFDASWRSIDLDGTATALASNRALPVIVDDTRDGRFSFDAALASQGIRSHAAVPLLKRGRVVGSFNLGGRRAGMFARLDPELVDAVASSLALAVDNALLFERMRNSEDRYSSLVESAREIIYRTDSDGNLTFANQAAASLLGRPREELIGRKWLELVAAEDAASDPTADLRRGAADDVTFDLQVQHASGHRIGTRHRVHAIRDADGALSGFQGIAQDTSEAIAAARATRLHQDLVEALDDIVIMADTSGRLMAMSRKGRTELGWDPETMADMTLWELHPPEDRAVAERERWAAIESGARSFEIRLCAKNGRLLPTRANITYSAESGTLQGVYRDVTEENLVRERLLQVERLRALGEMASGVAHTFNNLLAVIGTTAQVCQRLATDERLQRELTAIRQAVHDGGDAVRRLQDFGRDRAGTRQDDIDLEILLGELVRNARNRAASENSGHRIEADLDRVPTVRGNHAELRDVFLNLVFNAMDAMPAGGKVRVSCRAQAGGVLVEVADHGRGMSPEIRQRVFTPFFSTKGERGSGLGLAIARNVITQLGGSIRLDTELGRGTTVRVHLPESTPGTVGGRRRALLVETEPVLRMHLARDIAKEGHSVRSVDSGADALAQLRTSPFDCVFIDAAMPPSEIAREVIAAARSNGARVVLLIGWGDELDEGVLRELEVETVLRKPFSPRAILNLLNASPPSARG